MRIVVLYGEVAMDAPPDEVDVLIERDAVCDALKHLGFEPCPVPLSLNIDTTRKRIQQIRPSLIFNLVESVVGSGRWITLGPTLAESLAIPYTGAGLDSLMATCHKPNTKILLRAAGLATPDWYYQNRWCNGGGPPTGPYIIKSVLEHASIGIDQQSVVPDINSVHEKFAECAQRFGGQWFAEQYIEGREFNLSVIGTKADPIVLPVAEIRFTDHPSRRFSIVDYEAKWNEDSLAYKNTSREFDFVSDDEPLLEELGTLARACWDKFGLIGYARIDFRVDGNNKPWILEINVNPCISPDAGLVAAAAAHGLSYEALVDIIVRSALETVEGVTTIRSAALA